MKNLKSPLILGAMMTALALAGCESTPESTTGSGNTGAGFGNAAANQPPSGSLSTAPVGSGMSGATLSAAGVADTVFFGFDAVDLTPQARATLERQAAWLKANPQRAVTIEGHCDERGTREYNLALGDRRANSVKNYLVSLGVQAGRIRTLSYGKERPVAIGATDAAWAQNRRGVTVAN